MGLQIPNHGFRIANPKERRAALSFFIISLRTEDNCDSYLLQNIHMRFSKIIVTGLLSLFLFSKNSYSQQQKTASNNGFAVVELFTSEGCSSCPAAEAVLSQLNDEHLQNVYLMEFHVDYWNYIGWKDVFSSSEYTKRQQQYASVLGLSSNYTPQAIVNGKNELVGSDKPKLRSLVKAALQTAPENIIGLAAKAKADNVTISYTVAHAHDQLLNIALVQETAETDVRRGENSGRKLKHIHIVRELKVIDAKEKGEVSLALPKGLAASDCIVIAYTQNKEGWNITGAAEKIIE